MYKHAYSVKANDIAVDSTHKEEQICFRNDNIRAAA